MKFCFEVLRLLFLLACINRIFTAPIDDNKKNERCATAKGSIRSSVEDNTSNNKQVHLLADLDALSHGIKRAATEDDCSDNADKKTEVKELSAGAVSGAKRDELNKNEEETLVNQIVNDEETSKGSAILEAGKAAIRSIISTNVTDNSNSSANTTVGNDSLNKGEEKKELNAAVGDAKNETRSITNAKTFIARTGNSVSNNKKPVTALPKVNIAKSAVKPLKQKIDLSKGQNAALSHRSLHASIVPDDAPAMQRGSLSKVQEKHVKASTKSAASIIAPLNNAIKSLDSATKLLGAAAAGTKTSGLVDNAVGNKNNPAPPSLTKAALLPKAANATSVDITSTARSSSSSGSSKSQQASAPVVSSSSAASPSQAASSSPASPAAAASTSTSKAPSKIADPYAEIASGPDSPKTPDLKTGSEKAGLPVMKVDSGSDQPEPVSFDKEPTQEPAPVEDAAPTAAGRPGPQDVGGVLDKLTDRLNKGGSAIEQPLPPNEAKGITDQLNQYDSDALQTAKGWESNGLKAIEKLKSAEFKHGNMKNELSKELSERLNGGIDMSDAGSPEMAGGGAEMGGGGGYNAALGAGIGGGQELQSEAPSYSPQTGASHYSSPSQWSQQPDNSLESLDSEAQREEQSYQQYAQNHADNYAERYGSPSSESSLSTDANAYDRQDISNYLGQQPARDGMDIGSEQGQYFKRSVILRPLYYYYQHLPYAFKHPYDD